MSKILPLTQGQQVLLDDDDYWKAVSYKWHATHHNQMWTIRGYVEGNHLQLKRFLLNADKNTIVGEINGNPFDLRRANLRVRTKVRFLSVEEQLATRFVRDERGCKIWTGPLSDNGYGLITVAGRQYRVHRLVASVHLGLDLDDYSKDACHTCDNPPCYELDHLFVGTRTDNMEDASRKGRLKGKYHPCGEDSGVTKFADSQVIEIRKRFWLNKEDRVSLAEEHEVTPAAISSIVYGINWKHLPNFASEEEIAKARDKRGEGNYFAKLQESQVIEIRKRYWLKGETGPALAKEFILDQSAIHLIIKGRNWKHVWNASLEEMKNRPC